MGKLVKLALWAILSILWLGLIGVMVALFCGVFNCWFVEIPTGDRIMSGISLILVVFVFIMLNGLMKLLREAESL